MDALDKRSITSPENGKKGGVKTDAGKMISSQNSFKHGILAKFSTDFDDITFETAYELFANEFGDYTPSRQALISQVTILFIRLRRCARFEADFMRYKLNPAIYEKKLISKGHSIAPLAFLDEYEEILVSPGEPMKLEPICLSELENIYTKYEFQFLNQFRRLTDYLTRSAK